MADTEQISLLETEDFGIQNTTKFTNDKGKIVKQILLVEPEKYTSWGANQQHIGLLRIGAYHQAMGDVVEYVYSPNLPKKCLNPDIVYVTSLFTYWYKAVHRAVRKYKRLFPRSKVILGGIYATICPEHAKMSGADEVMIGQHPQAKFYPPNPNLLPIKPEFAYCMTSFGCSGNCEFCASHILHKGFTQRKPEDIVREISLQYRRGYKKIYFGDDDILFKAEEHFIPTMKLLQTQNMKIEYYIYGGMQLRWVTPEIANIFKENFKIISFGFESASEEVLRQMNRQHLGGVQTLKTVLSYLKEAGWKNMKDIIVFYLIGLPYQTEKDMLYTTRFLLEQGVWAEPQRWTPIPGTVAYNKLDDQYKKLDYEELDYLKFVGPNQSDEFLKKIKDIAKLFNYGSRYAAFDIFNEPKEIRDAIFKIDDDIKEEEKLLVK